MYRTAFSCLLLPLILPLAILPACASTLAADDAAVATEAIDSTSVSQTEAALLVPAVDGADTTATPTAIAAAAATKAPTFFQPASCVTATAAGATVTYQLEGCSGPYGLARVTGSIDVTFSTSAAGLGVSVTASGVGASGAKLDLDAQATYAASSGGGTLTVTTKSSGTGPLGSSITHQGSYTATWDDTTMCAGIDGTWSTTGASARKWSTTVSGLQACAGKCPASGGTVVYEGGILGETVTVDFSGGATADWSATGGRSGEVDLLCTAGQ